MTVLKVQSEIESVSRNVALRGLTPIMFDRYAGDNQTKLEAHQKFYFIPGTKRLALPALNVMSFLSAHNTNSAPKRLRDKRKYKDLANAILSFVSISPELIPFMRNGEPIEFGKFDKDEDSVSDSYVHFSVARLDKGIPNPKVRPVLRTPWSLEFTLSFFANREIKEQDVQNLLQEGGAAIGLGTFRGVFGKFTIDKWD
jgi:hypothetical protein